MTALRLGTYYRRETLDRLGLRPPPGARVLDIGCHDGAIIDDDGDAVRDGGGLRVGVDLSPAPRGGIHYVRADGAALPFRRESFDWVLALEVVEHAADPRGLVEAGLDALRPGGRMVISAPHRGLRLFPAAITGWMHERWGHGRGFDGLAEEDLRALLPPDTPCEVHMLRWRGGDFLRGYWMLRLAWDLAPPVARRWARGAAERDARATSRIDGNGNYLIFAVLHKR